MRLLGSVALSVVALALAGPAQAGPYTEAAGLRFLAPGFWKRAAPGPAPVAARFILPRHPKDSEDGALVVLFSGPGKGGSAEENLERWYGEFQQPDGRPSREAAVVQTRTIGGLKVTQIDLGGTYAGKSDYRLSGAIVEGDGGPWLIRLLGPSWTITEARQGWNMLVASLQRAR
jgi:hypothetical protein